MQETECNDRLSMRLPGLQDEVISALSNANKNFAIIMSGGSPYAMPWINDVPAVLHMGYSGMEVGTAVAGIIFGDVNPSGKLPFSFPKRLLDSPGHHLKDYQSGVCYYKEDIFVGYRWFDDRDIEPRYCFGHGLSYTTFEYKDLIITNKDDGFPCISFEITNSGKLAGAEVAQLYLRDCHCSVRRPQQELKNYSKVYLRSGESKRISFHLKENDLEFFHPTQRQWMIEEGEFEIRINSSSRDQRLEGTFIYSKPS